MSHKNDNDIRKARNEQLIRRMKAGEPLWSYDSKASWFPPRPIIQKDPDAIKRLYDGKPGQQGMYRDPTVRHIETNLKLVSAAQTVNQSDKIEDVG